MEPAVADARPIGRIRLLWLIDSLTVGGAESLVVPFVRDHDRERYELFVCSLTTIAGNAIEKEVMAEGVPYLNAEARSLRDFRAFGRLMQFVRDNRIELIHAHLTYAATWSALLSRLTGVPALATLHVAPPRDRAADRARDYLMRTLLSRWAARVVTVSSALRDRYLAAGGLDPRRVVPVHNGIECERFAGDAGVSRAFLSGRFGIPMHARIVVVVSVLREGKGLEFLLQGIDSIVERIPEVFFLIVGDGPKREEWTGLAARSRYAGRVKWAGSRRDVDAILPGCDLLVQPSLDDAFPTVLLEAMAAGLPVVATAVGGIPEIVDPEVTGKLVPPGDAEALGDAIASLLADRHRAAAMKRAARSAAVERFSTAAWLARLDDVYSDVLFREARRD